MVCKCKQYNSRFPDSLYQDFLEPVNSVFLAIGFKTESRSGLTNYNCKRNEIRETPVYNTN